MLVIIKTIKLYIDIHGQIKNLIREPCTFWQQELDHTIPR